MIDLQFEVMYAVTIYFR